ncbi:MAG: L,D-transpeptidase family protein [Thermoanaerobaculia bacterium]
MIPEIPPAPTPHEAPPIQGCTTRRACGGRRPGRVLRLAGIAALSVAIVGVGAALGLARYGGPTPHPFQSRLELPDPASVKGDPRRAPTSAGAAPHVGARETCIVVDTFHNRLRLYRGQELLREAICSTGSGIRLRDPRDGKEWVFDTPQGELRILRKQKNPIWIKPDWAFIEEGSCRRRTAATASTISRSVTTASTCATATSSTARSSRRSSASG